MHQGKLVFSHVITPLPLTTLRRCAAINRSEHKVKDFSFQDQFFAMAFVQLTYRESLRDIAVNLRAQAHRLYHMGFRCSTISRNMLANASRPWQIYAYLAQHLITIVHPSAAFRSAKAVIKLHTLLDLRGSIPSFIHITDGKAHQVNILDDLVIRPRTYYLVDRCYLEFVKLYKLHAMNASFVTRAESNNLRIKAFLGTSENAMKTQTRIVVCTYAVIAIIKKSLHLSHSLCEILRILSLTMLETTPINQLLTAPSENSDDENQPKQMPLL